MSDARFEPYDYDLEDENDPTQMRVLPEGRNGSACRVAFLASTHDLSTLARRVSDLVASDSRVLLVYVFGSYARGDIGPLSDLDIAVLLTRTASVAHSRADLIGAFSTLSGHTSVDLIILNQTPIELAYSVISQGKVLYARTLAERVEYEANVLGRYGDYLPFLRAQREDILEGAGNDRRVQRYRETLGRTQRTLGAPGTAKGTAC